MEESSALDGSTTAGVDDGIPKLPPFEVDEALVAEVTEQTVTEVQEAAEAPDVPTTGTQDNDTAAASGQPIVGFESATPPMGAGNDTESLPAMGATTESLPAMGTTLEEHEVAAATMQAPPSPPQRRGPGARKGAERQERPQSRWYELCELYLSNPRKYKSQAAFLRSEDSGPEFTPKHQMSFSRHLAKYRNGTLRNENVFRTRRKRKYAVLEEKMLGYLKLHDRLNRMGAFLQELSFSDFKRLTEGWALEAKIDFVCTAPWVTDVVNQYKNMQKLDSDDKTDLSSPKQGEIYTLEEAKDSVTKLKSFVKRQGMPENVHVMCDVIQKQMVNFFEMYRTKRKRPRTMYVAPAAAPAASSNQLSTPQNTDTQYRLSDSGRNDRKLPIEL